MAVVGCHRKVGSSDREVWWVFSITSPHFSSLKFGVGWQFFKEQVSDELDNYIISVFSFLLFCLEYFFLFMLSILYHIFD